MQELHKHISNVAPFPFSPRLRRRALSVRQRRPAEENFPVKKSLK